MAGRPALQKKVLKDTKPLTTRPGASMAPLDLGTERKKLDEKLGRAATDTQFASYLMYPKVFLDYASDRATFGDCAILPTPVFFYGMDPGDEVSVDIERGKTLIVRFVAVSEVRDDGTRQVFFELNGQPRSIIVTDRSQVAKRPPQRKMEAGQRQTRRRAHAGHHRHREGHRWQEGRQG